MFTAHERIPGGLGVTVGGLAGDLDDSDAAAAAAAAAAATAAEVDEECAGGGET